MLIKNNGPGDSTPDAETRITSPANSNGLILCLLGNENMVVNNSYFFDPIRLFRYLGFGFTINFPFVNARYVPSPRIDLVSCSSPTTRIGFVIGWMQ